MKEWEKKRRDRICKKISQFVDVMENIISDEEENRKKKEEEGRKSNIFLNYFLKKKNIFRKF